MEEEKLKKILEELKKFKFVKAIVLFGSKARKKATLISDFDICVIDDEKYPKKERRKVYFYSEKPFDISLFSDLPLYIKFEVLKGKVLWLKSIKDFINIREETTLSYLDQKWIWEDFFRERKEIGKWSIG